MARSRAHAGGARDPSDPARAGSRAARESIRRSATPAFSCLPDGTILNWNSAAERLFGVGSGEARRRRCWEIVAGRDVFDNDYCFRHCPIREMASRGRRVRIFRLTIRATRGREIPVRAMVLVPRDRHQRTEIIHLFDPLEPASPPREAPAA